MAHPLQVLLLIALVVLAAKLAGAAAQRLGQPSVFGELLAGLLPGPTVLNLPAWPVFAATSHSTALASLRDFADIGVVLLILAAGLGRI
jgi:Kef-type K+ transport system membrane component KefB